MKKKLIALLCVATVCILGLIGCTVPGGIPASDEYGFTVKTVDPSGGVITGAQVKIYVKGADTEINVTPVTGANGAFTYSGITGEATVKGAKAGYTFADLNVDKSKNGNTLNLVGTPDSALDWNGAFIYVAPDGFDTNQGTSEAAPVKTLEKAIEQAGKLIPGSAENVIIELKEGLYSQTETLVIDKTINAAKPVIIRGAAGKDVEISGGQAVTGWTAATLGGVSGVYKTNVGAGKLFRQLYVDDRPAIRARFPNVTPESNKDLNAEVEIATWNSAANTFSRPSNVNDNLFAELPASAPASEVVTIEAHLLQEWAHTIMLPQSKSIASGRMSFTVTKLDRVNIFQRMWPRRENDGNSKPTPLWFENSIKFLDAENEWFYDKVTGDLYYKPASGVNLSALNSADIYIPVTDTVVKIAGQRSTAANNKRVRNITFENILFEHTGWEYPSKYGLADQQSGQYQLGAAPDENGEPTGTSFDGYNLDIIEGALAHPPAAVWVEWAQSIYFNNCVVRNAGSTGIDFYMGVKNSGIKDSAVGYTAGNAISMGYYNEYVYATGQYAAAANINNTYKTANYNPTNKEEVTQDIAIENCYVTQAGFQYLFGSAIIGGYVKNVTIKNNTVTDVPFGGIQMGWGWSAINTPMGGFDILNNYVDGAMNSLFHDNGDIYFLGAHSSAEKTSAVRYNYVTHSLSSYAPLYLDMHSSEFVVEDNVLDNQYVTNQMYLYYHNMNQALKNIQVGVNFVRNDRVAVNNGAVLGSQNIDYPITWAYTVNKVNPWPTADIIASGKTYNIQGIINAAGVPTAKLNELKGRL